MVAVGAEVVALFVQLTTPVEQQLDSDALNSLAYALSLVTTVAYIPGLQWLWRSSVNAHSLKPDIKHTSASAVWWHFVPVANLIMPYNVMSEVGRAIGALLRPFVATWIAYVGTQLLLLVVLIAQFISASEAVFKLSIYSTLASSARNRNPPNR